MGCTVTRSKKAENSTQGNMEYSERNSAANGGSKLRMHSDGQADRRQERVIAHPRKIVAPTNNNFSWLISISPGQAPIIWTEAES